MLDDRPGARSFWNICLYTPCGISMVLEESLFSQKLWPVLLILTYETYDITKLETSMWGLREISHCFALGYAKKGARYMWRELKAHLLRREFLIFVHNSCFVNALIFHVVLSCY